MAYMRDPTSSGYGSKQASGVGTAGAGRLDRGHLGRVLGNEDEVIDVDKDVEWLRVTANEESRVSRRGVEVQGEKDVFHLVVPFARGLLKAVDGAIQLLDSVGREFS
ncbi:unnamed protein product [Closterium sp. NIES-65]|nr:unnamed protein product [Closterium sp. NIES-65]